MALNRTEAFNLIMKKQGKTHSTGFSVDKRFFFRFVFFDFVSHLVLDDVSAAGLFLDDLPPIKEKADGALDLGLPKARQDVDLGTSPLKKSESKLVQAYLNELAAQEQDHINLTNACKKVISAYEKSMERIAEVDFAFAIFFSFFFFFFFIYVTDIYMYQPDGFS
jgi:hypothetical protein